MKKTGPKTIFDIQREWNIVGTERSKIINEGNDFSFSCVTTPWIMRHLKHDQPDTVLDVGCGTGQLTAEMSNYVHNCTGIDVSDSCIREASDTYGSDRISFHVSEIKNYSSEYKYDLCVANMVFMSDPQWDESIRNIQSLLSENGLFYIMLAHPCFWPKYWGFESEEWFCYNEETHIECDFTISMIPPIGISTYIHRPLSRYIEVILASGFQIERIEEPYPLKKVPDEYKYDYPRFMFIKCRKAM